MQEHFPLKIVQWNQMLLFDWLIPISPIGWYKQSRKIKTLYSRDVGGQYYLFYY